MSHTTSVKGSFTRIYHTIKSAQYGTYLTAPDPAIDYDPATLSTTVGARQLWLMVLDANGFLRPTSAANGRMTVSIDKSKLIPEPDETSLGAAFVQEPRTTGGVQTTWCLRCNLDLSVTPAVIKYMHASSSSAVDIVTICGAVLASPPDMSADWIIEPVPFALVNRGLYLTFPTSVSTSPLFTLSTDSSQRFTCTTSPDGTNYLRSKATASTITTGFVGGDRAAAAGACVVASPMCAASMMSIEGVNPSTVRIRFGPGLCFVGTSEYKYLKISSTGVFSLENTYTLDDDFQFTVVFPS